MVMRFNEQNQTTLDNLLAALQTGLPGATGYNIYQDVLQQQMAQQQARQQRLQGFASNIINMASSGMPQANVTSIMDLLTPGSGVPPKVAEMLSTAFPEPPRNYLGHVMDSPQGSMPPSQLQNYQGPMNNYAPKVPYGQQQSPLYMDDPQQQFQSLMQEIQLQQALAPPVPSASQQETAAIGDLVAFINSRKAAGRPIEEILGVIMSDPEAAGLFAQHLDKLLPYIGAEGYQMLQGGIAPPGV